MILPKSNPLTSEQIAALTAVAAPFGCRIQPIAGAVRTVYAIVGDERHELMISRLEGLPFVDRVLTIQSPHKLLDIKSGLSGHRIRIGGITLGGEPLFIAGQCTIDPANPNYFLETAQAVKEAGAQALRGGVWKPRTNPYSSRGSARSLDILMEASTRTGLPVVTEVMEEEHVRLAVDAGVHVLQIGARNSLNYSLLRQIGSAIANRETVVLHKRGMHLGPLDEFIAAAEYIASYGNPNVILCPRGVKPGPEGYRNFPDESITPLLKERTWAPVVVDPSHSVGRARYVEACSIAAMAYGADGLCIECHVDPSRGLVDDPKQAVTPASLAQIICRARALHSTMKGDPYVGSPLHGATYRGIGRG